MRRGGDPRLELARAAARSVRGAEFLAGPAQEAGRLQSINSHHHSANSDRVAVKSVEIRHGMKRALETNQDRYKPGGST
jgi:hypothetical protein